MKYASPFPGFEARLFLIKTFLPRLGAQTCRSKRGETVSPGSGLSQRQVKDEGYNRIWLGASSPGCSSAADTPHRCYGFRIAMVTGWKSAKKKALFVCHSACLQLIIEATQSKYLEVLKWVLSKSNNDGNFKKKNIYILLLFHRLMES